MSAVPFVSGTSAVPFVFGTDDAPIAEMIDDARRMEFLESLDLGQIVSVCVLAIDEHDHSLRRAIDACLGEQR